MAAIEIETLLKEGIAAAKAGERQKALDLLLQVVDADERNEQAWLWLSGVVENTEDRCICLQNVLAINPDHTLAKQGLAKLEEASAIATDPDEIIVRREYEANSLAAAVLYPERLVKEWRYRDPTTTQQAAPVTIAARSTYDDVWSRGEDICAYCAHQLDDEAVTCPNCKRAIRTQAYRYPKPSVNLHILWVLLVGIGQLFLIQGFYHLIVVRTLLGVIIAGILMLIFFGLAVGVYFRQSWAHIGAILAATLVLVAALINAFFPIDLSGLDVPLSQLDPSIANFLGEMVNRVGSFIRVFQLAAVVLAFFYAVFRAAPDFQKMDVQEIAQLKRGLQFASDYHLAAKEFARQGKLATAVLHWQRAVAKESHHPLYLRSLGLAYAQLGFYERSLDILRTGSQSSTHPDKKADFEKLIQHVQRKQKMEGMPNQ